MPDQPRYHRILVIANETCPCPGLAQQAHDLLRRPDGELLLVAPALNSRLRHWVSDTDEAVRRAQERLGEALEALASHGVRARGEVGDADPCSPSRTPSARLLPTRSSSPPTRRATPIGLSEGFSSGPTLS